MSIASMIKKRQEGAPERKAKREAKKAKKAEHKAKIKALEKSAKIGEQERLRRLKEKRQAESAIMRGQKRARPTDYKKIAGSVGRGVYRVAKKAVNEEKPKRRTPIKRSVKKPQKKTSANTRKFGGVTFKLSSTHRTKSAADRSAAKLRNQKKKVRVVKNTNDYSVFVK